MRMHKAHSVQRKVSLALWGYTCNFDDRKAFVKEGGIEAVADVMMGNKTCEEIQFWGCRALMQLAGRFTAEAPFAMACALRADLTAAGADDERDLMLDLQLTGTGTGQPPAANNDQSTAAAEGDSPTAAAVVRLSIEASPLLADLQVFGQILERNRMLDAIYLPGGVSYSGVKASRRASIGSFVRSA